MTTTTPLTDAFAAGFAWGLGAITGATILPTILALTWWALP